MKAIRVWMSWSCVTAVLCLAGCGGGSGDSSTADAGAPAARTGTGARTDEVTGPAPTRQELEAATVTGILDEPITLRDGRYQGEPVGDGTSRTRVELLPRGTRKGSVDGIQGPATAFLLSESSGGSGTRLYLGAARRRDGAVETLPAVLVGDRVQVRHFRVDRSRVVLDLVQHGPDDPACCPRQIATRRYLVEDDRIVEAGRTDADTLSLDVMGGLPWILDGWGHDNPAPAEIEVSLEHADGRFAGRAGCNRYFASVREPVPGTLEVGPPGGTKMACATEAMKVEKRFLAALAHVTGYGFVNERLVLSWNRDGELGALYFRRQ